MTASGGDDNDFNSTKWSFYNSLTFNNVYANSSLATLTLSPASWATKLASLAYWVASASYTATTL